MLSDYNQILGMELSEAKSLLQSEGVNFVIEYTEADKKREFFGHRENRHRVVRIREYEGNQVLTVCVI